MHTRLGYVKAALSAFVIVATACGPAAPAPGPAGSAAGPTAAAPGPGGTAGAAAPTAADQPKAGGRLIIGDASDSKTLQPVISTDTSSSLVWARMYEGLLDVDAKTGTPVPRLAEKFDMSADSKTMTFTLRDGLQWSDGSAFSGDDFAFTVEAVMRSKRTVRKNIFQDIIGAKDYRDGKAESISGIKVDGKTITVSLETAFCPGLINIGTYAVLPKSVFGKYMDPKDATKNIDDAPENSAPTLAMGPFKFKEWQPNDHITLVRNDKFFGGPAYLDEWVRRVYRSRVGRSEGL
jgi:peptide/nickel transport system substrate-binding protein